MGDKRVDRDMARARFLNVSYNVLIFEPVSKYVSLLKLEIIMPKRED